MNIFTMIWNWLNGNKTILGLFVLAMIQQPFFTQFVPQASALWQALNWIFGLLATGGALHKLVKSNTAPGPNR